jgi:AraC family transcriptional regulator
MRRKSMLATQVVEGTPIQLTARARQELVELLATARHAVNDDPDVAHHCLDRVDSLLRPAGSEFAVGGLAPWQLRLVCKYIDEHLSDRITIEDLAAVARLSRSHFTRAFKVSVGSPPHNFILQQRIERAKELMLNSGEPLVQIALICGLADQSHFSRTFRAQAGCTPANWRRVNRQPEAA